MAAPKEYRVGDRVLRLEPFKGSKAVRALKLVTAIGRKAQPVLAEWGLYEQRYRAEHHTLVTRQLCEVRVAQLDEGPARDSWQRLLDGPLREQESVELPQAPTQEQKIIEFFPRFYEMAEEDVLRLLALVMIPNADLRAARMSGTVDATLDDLANDLLDEMELDALAELALDAAELLNGQLKGSSERLGKLRALVTGTVEPAAAEAAAGMEPDTRDRTEKVGTIVSQPTASNGSSSTDSPTPTDGAATKSSSERAGETSLPSPA